MTDKSAYQTGGAVVGAGVGSFFGPAGTLIGGGIGSFGGGLLHDLLNGDDTQDAYADKQAAMDKAAQQYAAYRPQLQNAHQLGLLQQLQAYGGADQALRTMYGSQNDPRVFAPNIGNLPNTQDPKLAAQVAALKGR